MAKECREYSKWYKYIDLKESSPEEIIKFYLDCSGEEVAVLKHEKGIFIIFPSQENRGMRRWDRNKPLIFKGNEYAQPESLEFYLTKEDGKETKGAEAISTKDKKG